ncbi:MAG: hypothetical protein AAFW67_10385 [Cyanobacteria bacterium J06638_38]
MSRKGSHTIWNILCTMVLTLSGKDAGRYQERDVKRAIQEVKNNET